MFDMNPTGNDSTKIRRRTFLISAIAGMGGLALWQWRTRGVSDAVSAHTVSTDITIVLFSDRGERLMAQNAAAQGELDPDPDHSWEGTNMQIFGNPEGIDDGKPKMKGFIKAYFNKRQDVGHSRNIMNCFSPDNLQVLTYLAQQYAVCDHWFSSLPGPTSGETVARTWPPTYSTLITAPCGDTGPPAGATPAAG